MGTSDFESFHGWACPWTPLESSRLWQSRKSPASFSLELDISVIVGEAGPAERIFKWGGLTRRRKREPTRGVRGHAPPGKFEILFF